MAMESETKICNCEQCGKFINPDAKAFFTPNRDGEGVVATCDEVCADKYNPHLKGTSNDN